jgi:hypothetical protein
MNINRLSHFCDLKVGHALGHLPVHTPDDII